MTRLVIRKGATGYMVDRERHYDRTIEADLDTCHFFTNFYELYDFLREEFNENINSEVSYDEDGNELPQ